MRGEGKGNHGGLILQTHGFQGRTVWRGLRSMLKELTFGYCFSEIWFSCACNVVGENAMENPKASESTELVAEFDFI